MKLPSTGDLLLGKYLLEKPLGEGGMGVVYAARHTLLKQRVAVKLIRPEWAMRAESVGRFLNEARAATSIDNEHVARVLDFGMLEDGLPYMVLEYLEGIDLAQSLKERGPLPVADVVDYLLQAIEAIAHAHAAGIVHRDLKPSNIFLARRPDGTSRVKVLDFGISKITGQEGPSSNMTRTNSILGSPAYMSPEQLRNAKNVDQRSDIWALGVVAYELLAGRPPFDAENVVELFALIQESEPASLCTLRDDVTLDLDAIVSTCLRRLPDERFASVTELGFALAPFGTAVAAAAIASSNRILPLRSSRPVAEPRTLVTPRQGNDTRVTHEVKSPISTTIRVAPAAQAVSTSPGVTSAVSSTKRKTRSRVMTALALAFLATLVMSGSVVVLRRAATRSGDPAAASSVAVASSAPLLASASTVGSASAATSAIASPEVAPPATTHSATSAGARAIPPVRTGGGQPSRPKSPSPPSCNPPYDLDKDGKKIWKRECI